MVDEEVSPAGEFPVQRVAINARGLRDDDEVPLPKPPGERRVLLLGDSFVEARQVAFADTLGEQLERRLAAADPAVRWRVVNAGCSSWSPAIQLVWLRDEGLAYEPDAVALFFCWNDVTDDHRYRTHGKMTLDARGLPVAIDNPGKRPDPVDEGRGVRILDLARRAWARLSAAPDPAQLHRTYPAGTRPDLDENELAIFKPRYTAAEEAMWARTLGHLAGMHELLAARRVPFAVVPVPAPPQVSARQWRIGKVNWSLAPDAVIASRRMQEVLERAAREGGYGYVDLLPVLAPHAAEKLYFDFDGHWTARAQELVAERMRGWVLDLKR